MLGLVKAVILICFLCKSGQSAPRRVVSSFVAIALSSVGLSPPIIAPAAALSQVTFEKNDLGRLRRGLLEVNFLLNNWDEKTIYCNFGEVKKEMLQTENKKQLLVEAASTGLLDYDKSATMNVLCRRDPEVVRAFLGLTQENLLLARADDLMRRPDTIARLDDDDVDSYLAAVEEFSVAVSNVASLGYSARSDFGATEAQTREQLLAGGDGRMGQTKASVVLARDSLQTIVALLHL